MWSKVEGKEDRRRVRELVLNSISRRESSVEVWERVAVKGRQGPRYLMSVLCGGRWRQKRKSEQERKFW